MKSNVGVTCQIAESLDSIKLILFKKTMAGSGRWLANLTLFWVGLQQSLRQFTKKASQYLRPNIVRLMSRASKLCENIWSAKARCYKPTVVLFSLYYFPIKPRGNSSRNIWTILHSVWWCWLAWFAPTSFVDGFLGSYDLIDLKNTAHYYWAANDLALLSTDAEIYQTHIETLQTACSHWFLFFNFINVYYHVV